MDEPVLKIVLDQPEDWMNENEMRRKHWSRRSYLADYWRSIALVKTRQAWKRKPPLEMVRIVITYYWPDSRRRDPNNWQMTSKAIVDGMVDAGLVPDDNMQFVWGPDNRGGRGKRRIEIEVYQIGDMTV